MVPAKRSLASIIKCLRIIPESAAWVLPGGLDRRRRGQKKEVEGLVAFDLLLALSLDSHRRAQARTSRLALGGGPKDFDVLVAFL